MARSTEKEVAALRRELELAAGSKEAAAAALAASRYSLPPSVTLGPYVDGSWTAYWLEGLKMDVRSRRLRLTVSEILTPGRVAALVRDAKRGAI